jgi:hypothetical protein
MSQESSRAVARRFESAFNSGDPEQVRRLFADDVTWTVTGGLPNSGTYVGIDAVMDDFLAGALPLFESLSFELTNVVADDDQVVVEWHADGKTVKGRDYEMDYVYVIGIRDDKLATVREYLDTEHFRAVVLD